MSIDVLPTKARDMFCHATYTAAHAINRAYAPHLQALGLTYPQYITLTLLWEEDGQKVNDLARQLHMETNTVTPLIKRLEGLGHVTRRKDDKDGRAVVVSLTEQGKELKASAKTITACMIEAASLSHTELTQLHSLLIRLRDGLEAAQTGK